jgi:hypothetical protein
MRHVRCPSCDHVTIIDDDHVESTVACEECGVELSLDSVPTRSAEPPDRPAGSGGVWSVLSSPGSGAVRALWMGLLLIVISFGVKQVIFSWSMWNLGTALEEPRLQAKRAAELAELGQGAGRAAREVIYDKYRRKFDELEGSSASAGASALLKLQWFCYLKILLDVIRMIGGILVLFAALHITLDPGAGSWLKAYGVVCGGVALVTVVLGGLLTLVG